MWIQNTWGDDYYSPPYQYYPWQQYQGYYSIPYRIGWQCPGCGGCYSPDVQKCWNCGTNSVNIVGTPSTINVNAAEENETKVDDGS